MFLNPAAREKKEFWLLNQDSLSETFFYLLIIFLPTQFGRHFWPNFSFVFGLRLDYLSPTIYFTDLIILTILVLSFKNTAGFIKNINKTNKILVLLSFFLLLPGIVFSKTPYAGFYGLLKLTEFFFLSTYIVQNFQKLGKRSLLIAFSIPIIYESLLSFLQFLNNGSVGGLIYFLGERTFNSSTPGIANASINGELILRPYATFPHPNLLAGFLIIYMLFLFNFFARKEKNILFILIALATASLFLTLSRAAILYWMISLIFLFATSIYKKYKKEKTNIKKPVFSFAVIIIFCFFVFQNTIFAQRFFETKIFEQSVVQRQELITVSLEMFLKNPLFGVGLNNFYFDLTNTTFIQPVHNIFLLILSEGGIVMFLTFIYTLTKALKTVLNIKNIYMFLALLSIIVLGSFDHYFLTLQQGQIMTALILGAIFSNKNKN